MLWADMGNYGRAVASLSLLGTVLAASCAPVGLPWSPGAGRPSVQSNPAVPSGPAAPVAPAPAAPAAVDYSGPLRLEIDAGAPDSALTVPALARPNLPPRPAWQAPEAPRVAFPQRIERWR